jgi:HD-GYP domain-containing protein (c-di-GMP phosphodiesterase class II)
VLSVGCNVLDDKSCTRLVQRFRDASLLQPVMQNHCASNAQFQGIDGLRSFMLTPMARGKAVMGWLLAINRVYAVTDGPRRPGSRTMRHEFGANEATIFRSTASVLATHATNVELLRDKDQLLLDMVGALVNAIDAKDPYTRGHSERVGQYAKLLGSTMGLKTRICKRLNLGGLLHDVGKIAIRDDVLSKTDKLDHEEFAIMQEHLEKGWEILYGLEALEDILAGVLHHHERWDGRGYPDKLAGEAIPIDARILAVADAFDAMTSDRPYRKSLPMEQVKLILADGAGTQWDPAIVHTFLNHLSEFEYIRNTYQPRQPVARRGYRMLCGIEFDQPVANEPLTQAEAT